MCHTVEGVLVVVSISVSVVVSSLMSLTSVGHDGVIVCTVLMLLQRDCCGFCDGGGGGGGGSQGR